MSDDIYKEEGGYEQNIDDREKNTKINSNDSSEEDFDLILNQQEECEEEPFNEYIHRLISEIYDYLSTDENHPLAASLLSTLSKYLGESIDYDITEDDLNLLAQISFNKNTLTVSKYAFSCISSILQHFPEASHFFISGGFLETIASNMNESEEMKKCDQIYDLLTTFCNVGYKNQVLFLFNISKLHSYSLDPSFIYTESFFDYLSCFLTDSKHEEEDDDSEKYILTDDDSKHIETFFTNALRVKNESFLPNLYKFAQKLAKKHLVHQSIWECMNNYIRTWNPQALKHFFGFVSEMALEGCFFVNIDLSFIFEIMKEYKDNKLLQESITMLCTLMESEDFYDILITSYPDILIYSHDHSTEGSYAEKSCYIQLLATFLRHFSSKHPIDEFIISCFDSVFQFLHSENDNDLLSYILESLIVFLNTIKVFDPSVFSQILEEIVDLSIIEEFQNSEDNDLHSKATEFHEICN